MPLILALVVSAHFKADCFREFKDRIPEDVVRQECARGEPGRQALLDMLLSRPPVDNAPTVTTQLNGRIDTLSKGVSGAVKGDVAALYGEKTMNAGGDAVSGSNTGAKSVPLPKSGSYNVPPKRFKTSDVPLVETEPDVDPGQLADWVSDNEERAYACPDGLSWWGCRAHKKKVAYSYWTLRVRQCEKEGRATCAHYKAMQYGLAMDVASFNDPVGFIKSLTMYGSAESLVLSISGDKEASGTDMALDAAGLVPLVGMLKSVKGVRAVKTIGKGAEAVHISEEAVKLGKALRLKKPAEACNVAADAILPSQKIASPQIVAEYALRMKAGLWDWKTGAKITIGIGEKGEKIIIDGHHRYLAARQAGVKIPAEGFVQLKKADRLPMSWKQMDWSGSH